jgi:hypothetical protein
MGLTVPKACPIQGFGIRFPTKLSQVSNTMTNNKKNPRNYSCKDEELSTIGGYALTNVRRDRAEFAAYSPKYNEEGLLAFDNDIKTVDELVNPQTEVAALKLITAKLYADIDTLFDKAIRIEGYIKMSKGEVPISAKDFGITALKQRAHAKDAVSVLQNARLVATNIKIHWDALIKQGLSETMIEEFYADIESISTGNQKQYDMIGNRRARLQANLDVLNALAEKIKDICTVGKILFRGNPGKLKEYTFSELKKKAHAAYQLQKTESENPNGSQPTK